MPCMKCANGKWKYGAGGNCQFDTLAACKAAAAAIHIQDTVNEVPTPQQSFHDVTCQCYKCLQIKNS